MKAFIFEHPVNQVIEKYFKQLKTNNLTNEGGFGTETREQKLLACSALKRTSQHLTIGRTRRGEGAGCHAPKVFLRFLLEDKISAPDVFSSCWFIPCVHFEPSLVVVGCYGYEIRRHK